MTMGPAAVPPTRWERVSLEDGLATYRLTAWSAFTDFLDAQVFTNRGRAEHRFIWRGQRRSDWMLDSSLDRLFERLGHLGGSEKTSEQRSQEHLEDFKYAARGRRGFNPPTLNENEWWALGQHFGLATPLLDWSHSPFAAAYFAFEKHEAGTSHRVVYGLDRDAVQLRNRRIEDEEVSEGRPSVLELIDPLSDENPRLVNQGALFTRAPIGVSVETWVRHFFAGAEREVLLRIELPDSDRTQCLRALGRMNINHLSLFPDLAGASRATNLRTEIDLLL
jgi:FRG domain